VGEAAAGVAVGAGRAGEGAVVAAADELVKDVTSGRRGRYDRRVMERLRGGPR
jgi:hypothetical protein